MKDTGYIQIQGWMINHLSLKPNELIAFAIIFGFSQDKVSYFTGSLKYLENAINVSKGTVISILKTLIERELILKRSNTINGVTFNDYAANFSKLDLILSTSNNTGSKIEQGVQKLDNGGSKIEQGGSTKIEPHNTIINNTSNTTREAGEKKLQNSFGVYDSIDDAIAEMKNHTDWKTSMCKQTGVSNVEDCDRWIDKFRDHAIASGITKFNLKDLKYHCFSWLRKRIGAGDKLPVVIDKTKKHIPNISHLQFH